MVKDLVGWQSREKLWTHSRKLPVSHQLANSMTVGVSLVHLKYKCKKRNLIQRKNKSKRLCAVRDVLIAFLTTITKISSLFFFQLEIFKILIKKLIIQVLEIFKIQNMSRNDWTCYKTTFSVFSFYLLTYFWSCEICLESFVIYMCINYLWN